MSFFRKVDNSLNYNLNDEDVVLPEGKLFINSEKKCKIWQELTPDIGQNALFDVHHSPKKRVFLPNQDTFLKSEFPE